MCRTRYAAILGLVALLAAGAASAQDWDKVQLKSLEIGDGIWGIHGAGGNHVLLAGPEGALLVDADYAEMSDKLLAKVHELAGEGSLLVVDTHWHFDHVGGNQALREAGATIVAHENVRSRMIAGQYLAVIDHESPPAEP